MNLYASFTTLWYEAGGEVIGCIGGDSSVTLYEEYIGRDITQDEGMQVVATSCFWQEVGRGEHCGATAGSDHMFHRHERIFHHHDAGGIGGNTCDCGEL